MLGRDRLGVGGLSGRGRGDVSGPVDFEDRERDSKILPYTVDQVTLLPGPVVGSAQCDQDVIRSELLDGVRKGGQGCFVPRPVCGSRILARAPEHGRGSCRAVDPLRNALCRCPTQAIGELRAVSGSSRGSRTPCRSVRERVVEAHRQMRRLRRWRSADAFPRRGTQPHCGTSRSVLAGAVLRR